MKHILSGIPSSPPYGSYAGSGPTGSAGDLPITANFVNKNQKMNIRIIAIIVLSAFVLLLVLAGAISVLIKWRKVGRPSNAVGPVFPSSINKRSGRFASELYFQFLESVQLVCDMMLVTGFQLLLFRITHHLQLIYVCIFSYCNK